MSLIGKIGTCAFDARIIHRGVYFDFRGDRLDASTWIECVPEGLRDAAKYIANRAEYRHSGMVASIDTLDSIRAFMASEAIRLVEIGAITRDGFTHPDKLNSKEKTNMDCEEISHAAITPFLVSNGVIMWCGLRAEDAGPGHYIVAKPGHITCENCKRNMNKALADLSNWQRAGRIGPINDD